MHLGIIGLGRMGLGLSRRLLRNGHTVSGTDRDADAVAELESHGGAGADDLEALAEALPSDGPRAFWIMVPAGDAVDAVIADLHPHLRPGDVVADGGNSNYKDSLRRAELLEDDGIRYVDVGVSGGVWGLEEGFALMIGGADDAVELLRPAFEALAPAPDKGWGHVGPSGAGHFVKMVHNGIEYGLMEAYAEGFALLQAKEDFGLDLGQVANVWRHGSVIRSWLLDLAADVYEQGNLEGIAPVVPDSGMGRWTTHEAVDLGVALPVLTQALYVRLASQDEEGYGRRLLAALRQAFGGHAVVSSGNSSND